MNEAANLGGRFLQGGEPFEMFKPAVATGERMVVFSTPCLDHRVAIEYLESAIRTEWALAKVGIKSSYKGIGGDCFVDKARNRLVTEYLQQFPNAEDFFFLDDDIGWPADKVVEFLQRPEPVLCGVYPRKTDNPEYPVTLEIDPVTQSVIEKDGLYKAVLVPTGFLRIKRWVLEQLVKDCRTYQESCADGTVGTYFELFKTGINPDDGRWWGEDSWLCDRLRKADIDIWVDADIQFTHRGHKKWAGNFGPSLREWLKQNPAQAAA